MLTLSKLAIIKFTYKDIKLFYSIYEIKSQKLLLERVLVSISLVSRLSFEAFFLLIFLYLTHIYSTKFNFGYCLILISFFAIKQGKLFH